LLAVLATADSANGRSHQAREGIGNGGEAVTDAPDPLAHADVAIQEALADVRRLLAAKDLSRADAWALYGCLYGLEQELKSVELLAWTLATKLSATGAK
jgi:hypothetical protein